MDINFQKARGQYCPHLNEIVHIFWVDSNVLILISKKCGQYCPNLNNIVHIFWVGSNVHTNLILERIMLSPLKPAIRFERGVSGC